jgi:hypothetical protein
MQFSKSILIAAVAAFMPLAGYADPITPSPTLAIDGLTFDNFTCSLAGTGSPTACSQINVNTITSPAVGIQITSGFAAAPGSFTDATITYDLSSITGINNVGLSFNGFFLGQAISSVTEQVFSGSTLVGSAVVSCSSAGCNQTDFITLNAYYTNLHIEKDINVTGFDGVAGASIIDQTFTASPEPSSTALLGGGLLMAAAALRRRAKLGLARA